MHDIKPFDLLHGKQENRMFLERLVVGDLDSNCYLVASEPTKEAMVIDPGGSAGVIMDTIAAQGLDVKYIILTHGHFDHFEAALDVARKTGAKIGIHKLDAVALSEPSISLAFWLGENPETFTPDFELTDGQVIKFGDLEAKILATPGHSPGSITVNIGNTLFTGDLLFHQSIGRTDFAGGSYESLLKSVREQIFKYPDQVKVYPGHGPSTTVGDERRNNPYFTG
ncbi:MBL fold metallo-hydrolase [Candidatus Aquicultor sp.]